MKAIRVPGASGMDPQTQEVVMASPRNGAGPHRVTVAHFLRLFSFSPRPDRLIVVALTLLLAISGKSVCRLVVAYVLGRVLFQCYQLARGLPRKWCAIPTAVAAIARGSPTYRPSSGSVELPGAA